MDKLRFKIESMTPDRTNYKQYNATFVPENLYLEVNTEDIPDIEFLSRNEIVLSPDALAKVMDKISTAYEKVHQMWQERR